MLSTINWAHELRAVSGAYAALPCASDGDATLRFDALAQLSGAVAHQLLASGLKPGEAVATCVRNGIPALWASVGVKLAGACETPLNPVFSAAERRYCLELAGVRRVVTTREEAPFFAALGIATTLIEDVAEAGPSGVLDTLPPVPAETWDASSSPRAPPGGQRRSSIPTGRAGSPISCSGPASPRCQDRAAGFS